MGDFQAFEGAKVDIFVELLMEASMAEHGRLGK